MKKYTQNISKLYETIGYEKIESGKTYTSAKGVKVTVNDIYIDAVNETAEVMVDYDYETPEGKIKNETARYSSIVDLLRSK